MSDAAVKTDEVVPRVPTTVPLVVADRCDAPECGAQALVRYLYAFHPLDFCGHHADTNNEALTKQGFTIDQDKRV